MVHQLQQALQRNEVLALFPEGTTGDGRTLRPFYPNLLQAAIACDAPVQPLGLRFVDKASGRISFAPSYTDDEILLVSLWRTLCAPPIEAIVHFGLPEFDQGRDRRIWALHLHNTVDSLRRG